MCWLLIISADTQKNIAMYAIPSRQDEYEDQALGLSASELLNEG